MNVTELAHWEYRTAALDEAVRKTRHTLGQVRGDIHGFFDDDIPALEDQLRWEQWLLEEARYKVTLGRWEQVLAAATQKNVEFLTELKRQIHYNAHDFGEMGKFIRTSYLDNMIDEQQRRLTDGS